MQAKVEHAITHVLLDEWIESEELEPANDIFIGDFVVLDDWIGQVCFACLVFPCCFQLTFLSQIEEVCFIVLNVFLMNTLSCFFRYSTRLLYNLTLVILCVFHSWVVAYKLAIADLFVLCSHSGRFSRFFPPFINTNFIGCLTP